MAEYEAKVGPTDSVIADPRFRITVGVEPLDKDGKKLEFLGDWLVSQRTLDFPDLFATNPELVRRKIGLIPEEFKDFAFDRRP
ncbi:MAG: hypothetical protein FJ279_22145 [Planctomycetes bacterium]|nr:hypothetical protein [Planctomycetota bacterium]